MLCWQAMGRLAGTLGGEAVAKAAAGLRIRFAAGAAVGAEALALVPALIQHFGDLANICVNVEADELGCACARARVCV